ncbi:MAG: site-2 protease family protein [Thiotrichales bacterium 12-47-6]|nr:MAG: site-2 protease family protein [Thiotrichales bacterium 16-46-22]OZB86897.1 MAG: site-2 protease family protein [Thiotrichales bacterium 12-47-6]HQT03110.1 site-2 protease family protein [Thiotrichales bacterium]HQT04579.1 site-2 protease family protein [Thiotrichales bacterium]
MNDLMLTLAIWTIPVLLAITLHEVAHGWAALAFGDRTAQLLGRLSLNPLKHVDPVGTVVVPLSLLLMSWLMGSQPFLFGWAKPVPVSMQNLSHPKRDMAWVAIAGPASNFVQAIGWALLLTVSIGSATEWLHSMAIAGISINLILIALNLLPIPPLDGSRVLTALLPNQLGWQYNRLEPYGLLILIGLMVMGWLTPLIMPLFNLFKGLVLGIVGLT